MYKKYILHIILIPITFLIIGYVVSFNPIKTFDQKANNFFQSKVFQEQVNSQTSINNQKIVNTDSERKNKQSDNTSNQLNQNRISQFDNSSNSQIPVYIYFLKVDFGNNNEDFSIELENQEYSVFEVMKELEKKTEFSFKYKTYSIGIFVEEIMGIKNNPTVNKYWLYYVNGKFADKGVDKMQINNGDIVTWEYKSAF
ncbi:MAG: DUF4430 domain-containing protein [Promethearchaeota archaeon]